MPPQGILNRGLDCYWITLLQCLKALPGCAGLNLDYAKLEGLRGSPSQEDAHEVLVGFMSTKGFPEDEFKINFRMKSKCCGCGKEEEQKEETLVWSVPLHSGSSETIVPNVTHAMGVAVKPHETEEVKCDDCKESCKKKKSVIGLSLPKLLVLHLQRFEYKDGRTVKIDEHVRYPTELTINKAIYNLKSVACHYGRPERGHYFALVHDAADGKWYLCDDEKVECMESNFETKFAYLLFYELA